MTTEDKLAQAAQPMLDLLREIRWYYLDGEIDVDDGSDGPRPNTAMSVCAEIDELLRKYGLEDKEENR